MKGRYRGQGMGPRGGDVRPDLGARGLVPSRTLAALAALALGAVLPPAAAAQSLADAQARLRAGAYDEALAALRTLARDPGSAPEAARAHARALMEVGRYEEALRAVAGSGGRAASPELETVYGEALRALGRGRDAEAAFRRALDGGSRDRTTARLNLGIVLWDRGDRAGARSLFDSFIDLYNRSRGALSAHDLMAVGTAVRYLGITSPPLFQDALLAYDEAARADPLDPGPELLAGELFLEKYRATDARESFRKVLSRNPRSPRALLGLARILDFEDAPGAADTVRLALETNPRSPDARAFLAGLHLKAEDHADARKEALAALEVNPEHLGALSVLAATHYVTGDQPAYGEARDRALALNPAYADLYATVAELAVTQRQYRAAVTLTGQAVALDSTSWRSWGVMGMNQIRTGAMEEGRRSLERAFAGDPHNPWYMNTLDLLDTFVRYRTVRTDHFEILLHEREAELLEPYAREVAEAAYAGLQGRYGAEPPTPVRIEIFPSHADFSVRTLGLPGLGALGVSFGSTLVMDSPSAQEPGYFNWASTLWHEVAHAFHLAMSDHKVPRWFTEGLAVLEQRKAQPRWGFSPTPAWLQAWAGGQLHPVSRLSEGFIRPAYPEQVVFSYYQASLVLELIESRWGLRAVRAMLQGYREGKDNDRVFRDVLGQSPEAFDTTFDTYVQDRWGERVRAVALSWEEGGPGGGGFVDLDELRRRVLQSPGSFLARLALGKALLAAERVEDAEKEFRAALLLFPEYGGMDSPYLYLARIHKQRGETERAARALQQLGGLSETQLPAHLEEAELWLGLGKRREAAQALERAVEIAPFEVEAHRRLAELYSSLAEHRGAVRERGAVLALNPPDRADAHYRLALALRDAGERDEARRQVLRSLEIAPGFQEAQDLLLELRRRRP